MISVYRSLGEKRKLRAARVGYHRDNVLPKLDYFQQQTIVQNLLHVHNHVEICKLAFEFQSVIRSEKAERCQVTLIELRTESGAKRTDKAERCDRKMD